MVVLITGTTHTGKTALAQKLMEKYKMPYLSIDHLKMGLIRSAQTSLTAGDDEKLVPYLWSIVSEMIKTVIENGQNLIVEGHYIPFDFEKDFEERYLKEIRFCCLIMTPRYIVNHFSDIVRYENVAERRLLPGALEIDDLIEDNEQSLRLCKKYGLSHILIDETYEVDIEL